MRIKFIVLSLLLSFSALLSAQEGNVVFNLKGGNNAVQGNFTALSLEAQHSLKRYFSVEGGVQYNSAKGIVVEARPAYFYDFSSGRLRVEALLHYSPYSDIHNYALGAGVNFTARYISATLGYYYRAFATAGSTLNEPFNLYYGLTVNCLPSVSKWDLMVSLSNCRIFELERHYQPSLNVDGWWYPAEKIGVTLGVCYKPAGMFNLSSDYYQFYANIGGCYKW